MAINYQCKLNTAMQCIATLNLLKDNEHFQRNNYEVLIQYFWIPEIDCIANALKFCPCTLFSALRSIVLQFKLVSKLVSKTRTIFFGVLNEQRSLLVVR